ncbi:glycoside hydrolase family 16 protein [Neiella marina]|uniref:Glycoside hydrolase family 16 protein n=1 Tax=Neiella holothuriorum TaxID=2870530 RepID=A0ABS7EC03_9GAMM|nr:glycoside hydrolase family 16 protein [Neiella holothuriorum]MBW8189859.1 glycoside hydrolase family 16 protein [Neiella holothuriorum]
MKTIHLLPLAIAVSVGLSGCSDDDVTSKPAEIPMTEPGGWTLAWQDEFDGSSIDTMYWEHEVNCDGGGNNERQCYTADEANSYIEDGVLKLVALPADGLDSGKEYTSARLRTKGMVDFTYGRVEIRAKAPTGQGSFPAAWMLPTDNVYGTWPLSGEIDILEFVNTGVPLDDGGVNSNIYGTLHYGSPWPNNAHSGSSYLLPDDASPADDFHVYAIEWEEGEIRWYVDDVHYATQLKSEVTYDTSGNADGLDHKGWYTEVDGEVVWDTRPFDQDFHILINFAVGGDWAENTDLGGVDETAFHADNAYEIDYVRVYKCETAALDGSGCATVDFGYHYSIDEGGTLVEGEAPTPIPPSSGVAENLTIFEDEELAAWPAWVSDAATTDPEIVEDEDADYGTAVQMTFGGAGMVAGFNTREADEPELYDASPMESSGKFEFDLKLVSAPIAGDVDWYVKIEQNSGSESVGTAADMVIDAPTLDTWTHYEINLSDLTAKGLELNGIDVVMVFPAWGEAAGTVYRIDNVEFTGAENAGDDPGGELVLLDENGPAEGLIRSGWDEADGGDIASISDEGVWSYVASGGGNNYLEVEDGSWDYSDYLTWDLIFDMKVNAIGDGDSVYVKFDSGWPNVSDMTLAEAGYTLSADGEWATYTISVSELFDNGNDFDNGSADPTNIANAIVFEGSGSDVSIEMRNIRLYKEGTSTGDDDDSGSDDSAVDADPMDISAADLLIFDDSFLADWPAWDCCLGTTPALVNDATRGDVVQYEIVGNGQTVVGFYGRDTAAAFDASGLPDSAKLVWDMKLVTPADAGDVSWLLKVETGSDANYYQGSIDAPTSAWTNYEVSLGTLRASGVNFDDSAIDIFMFFPAWGTGTGAVFQVDNVAIIQ